MGRIFNFSAGPAVLPLEILEEAAKDLVDFKGLGLSLLEMSHRSKPYEAVHNEAVASIKSLLNVPDNFDILFIQGGASTQFAMVPMNIAIDGKTCDYITTGTWSEKALKEAKIIGKSVKELATTVSTNHNRIPKENEYKIDSDASFVHITSNNTIFGTQFKKLPDTKGVPLVIDASSDFMSWEVDWKNVGIIYAGAQKNAGPAGVTIVIIRKDLYEREKSGTPTMMKYSTHAKENSLYNTAPTFAIYMVGLNAKWLLKQGGVKGIIKKNEEKAGYIYDVIDNSNGFYKGHAEKDSRSLMNVTFVLKDDSLSDAFNKEAEALKLSGLKGHRSVGGFRASIYNAMPAEGCKKLADFMKDFMKRNG